MKRTVALSLALLLLIPGCITFQTLPPGAAPPAETPPVIVVFSSNPATIISGGTSTLIWNVTGANAVSIDQGIGQVEVAGARAVSPSASTVYTLSASNTAGTVTRSAVLTVNPASLPQTPVQPPAPTTTGNPVINFTASHLGGTSWQLNWQVSNATQVVIQPDIGPVNLTGSTVVTVPSGQTKLFRLEAVNDWGWAYWQVMVQSP